MLQDMRLFVVDDHRMFRDVLLLALAGERDFEIVGTAEDARSAYIAIDAADPDVVVMDVSLPGVDGIAAAREVKRRAPQRRVVMLSMHADAGYAAHALLAGASGFVCKNDPLEELFKAVRAAAAGASHVSAAFPRALVDENLRAFAAGEANDPWSLLSRREREVFGLLVRGFGNPGIAQELCISIATVETHRRRILRKLQVHSIAELIRCAARHNLPVD